MRRLNGVVLSGGRSRRMGQDKGTLVYDLTTQEPQSVRCFKLLSQVCEKVYISCRPEQQTLPAFSGVPLVFDTVFDRGPAAGILSAFELSRDRAWFVLACDLPLMSRVEILELGRLRASEKAATAFFSDHPWIEPLCAIWEPKALLELEKRFQAGDSSPRKVLESLDCEILFPPAQERMLNANTQKEATLAKRLLSHPIDEPVQYL